VLQIGLYPYTGLLRRITEADGEVGILAIELLAISMRTVMGRAETCIAFAEILTSLGIDRFILVGHSYGTVVGTHLLRSPELGPRIAGVLLIDPIPLLLHMPNIAYNFVYRQPRSANEWQLWYFASRDADVSRSLSRHFFWTENVLWKEELDGRPVVVVLSGDDQIVDSEAVRLYLTGEDEASAVWERDSLKVLFYTGLDHATVFDSRERVDQLVRVIEGLDHVNTGV
jgi:pimeloyl-ACP methyl ester carboxylesterase